MVFTLPVIYTMNKETGTLYIVATPIGNLEDITLRALRILKEVDEILCEDTRQTIKLLNHYDIKNKLSSYHKYNEQESADKIIEKLQSGKDIALVSDAGLPLISDPGSVLVVKCNENDIKTEVLPGANAALSALQLSGLDSTRFTFFGFSPKNNKDHKKFIDDILSCPNTAIVYESPHHLVKTLKEISEIDPNRKISISREITKKFEETIRGSAEELFKVFDEKPPKGEFVLVIEKGNISSETESDLSINDLMEKLMNEGLSEKDAIKKVASLKGLKKRDVYKQVKIEKN